MNLLSITQENITRELFLDVTRKALEDLISAHEGKLIFRELEVVPQMRDFIFISTWAHGNDTCYACLAGCALIGSKNPILESLSQGLADAGLFAHVYSNSWMMQALDALRLDEDTLDTSVLDFIKEKLDLTIPSAYSKEDYDHELVEDVIWIVREFLIINSREPEIV